MGVTDIIHRLAEEYKDSRISLSEPEPFWTPKLHESPFLPVPNTSSDLLLMPKLSAYATRYRVPVMPGAMSIEVIMDLEAGVDIIKIFPEVNCSGQKLSNPSSDHFRKPNDADRRRFIRKRQ